MNEKEFEQLRNWISEFYGSGRIRLNRTLLEVIAFNEPDSNVDLDSIATYVVESTNEQVTPLLNVIREAIKAPGDSVLPNTHTAPGSEDRKHWVFESLGIASLRASIEDRYPKPPKIVVVDDEFNDWYTADREAENCNYWNDYKRVLERKGWTAESIESVNLQAREVVRRLADPRGSDDRATRGLVVGYVQSGKTANFTAVAAKAIDAGYRMIIVLAGMQDNLRYQTQRRLDMELFGREAVLDGRDEHSLTARDRKLESYFDDDDDWYSDLLEDGRGFISHGPRYGTEGFPEIRRLTTSIKRGDYKGSQHGIRLSDFTQGSRRLSHDAIEKMPCFVAVVKKNSKVLEKLSDDLARSKKEGLLERLPILVIDDESDQASINTRDNKKKSTGEEKERTAVNRQITNILKNGHPAQYVGYTATPFANVFIDPSDAEDLYPKSYALVLDEPPAYRGAKWFHDRMNFRGSLEEATISNSRSKAFLRILEEEPIMLGDEEFVEVREEEIREALDMFVLTGGIKKFREQNSKITFDHHTMLVHEATDQSSHRNARDLLVRLWHEAAYVAGGRLSELEHLYLESVQPVISLEQYNDGFPVPSSFDELVPFIGDAVQEISRDVNRDSLAPVLTVNSEGGDEADFAGGKVWKILVGGLKLSRGYTVEGLTVSYFRRRSGSADTLMQTGRWFGFRRGYQDLVRLYAPESLIELFEASMQDEDAFREFVSVYSKPDSNGAPKLNPMRLAAVVRQSLPNLPPTAKNKMFNAYIQKSAAAPGVAELTSLPTARRDLRHNNMEVALPLLESLGPKSTSLSWFRREATGASAGFGEFFTGTVSGSQFVELLGKMRWFKSNSEDSEARGHYYANNVAPKINYLSSLLDKERETGEAHLSEVAVLLPHVRDKNVVSIRVPGLGFDIPLIRRKRRSGRADLTGADRKHTYPLQRISTGRSAIDVDPGELAQLTDRARSRFQAMDGLVEPFSLGQPESKGRAAVLLMLFDDRKDAEFSTALPSFEKGEVGFALAFNSPHSALDGEDDFVEWAVHLPGNEAIIDIDELKDIRR